MKTKVRSGPLSSSLTSTCPRTNVNTPSRRGPPAQRSRQPAPFDSFHVPFPYSSTRSSRCRPRRSICCEKSSTACADAPSRPSRTLRQSEPPRRDCEARRVPKGGAECLGATEGVAIE